jgi:hypothetical protein
MQSAPSQGAISGSARPSTTKDDSVSRSEVRQPQAAESMEPLPGSAIRVGSGMLVSSSMEPKPIAPVTVLSTSGAALSVPQYSTAFGYKS